ncbi:MAG: methylmalonyl Co-A mutase-associated GTPase MeaB [Bacteroidia bacterium]
MDNNTIKYRFSKKELPNAQVFAEGIIKGDITLLSRAITLLESTLPEHHILSQEILELCLPHSGNSIRIGITGVPGVGKSTFINVFGDFIIQKGHKVAVLAIDPSSQITGGSILGDKTRMDLLSSNPKAYIRPSPSAGALGGVANATRESMLLCEAAGFDIILIETVGVGQSEIAVHGMVDFFLLLMLAGAGDELQGIKRGIMEMADAVVINKADGDNIEHAKRAKAEYAGALHLFPPMNSGWQAVVEICSAIERIGLDKIWEHILAYRNITFRNGYFEYKRKEQAVQWMHECINTGLKTLISEKSDIQQYQKTLEQEVIQNKITPYKASRLLLERIFK